MTKLCPGCGQVPLEYIHHVGDKRSMCPLCNHKFDREEVNG